MKITRIDLSKKEYDDLINRSKNIIITGETQDNLNVVLTLTKIQDAKYVKEMNIILNKSYDENDYYIQYSSKFDKELSHEQISLWLNNLGLVDSVMIPSPKPRLDKWSAKNIRAFMKLINLKDLTVEI